METMGKSAARLIVMADTTFSTSLWDSARCWLLGLLLEPNDLSRSFEGKAGGTTDLADESSDEPVKPPDQVFGD